MKVLSVSDAAHAAVKAAAESSGQTMAAVAEERLTSEKMLDLTPDTVALLKQRAEALGCSPEEAIVRLLAGGVQPKKAEVKLAADGQPFCRCDGPEEAGSWHRASCHRWRPA